MKCCKSYKRIHVTHSLFILQFASHITDNQPEMTFIKETYTQ